MQAVYTITEWEKKDYELLKNDFNSELRKRLKDDLWTGKAFYLTITLGMGLFLGALVRGILG